MRSLDWILLGSALLQGCGSLGGMSAQALAERSVPDLCDSYARDPDERIWGALETRAGFSAEEAAAIREGRVYVGMSENALICVWGIPSHHGGVVKQITSYGVYKTYLYRDVDWSRHAYTAPKAVLVQDGRVAQIHQ